MTYIVKVKDGQVQVGHNEIPLNGNATLNYTVGESGEVHKVKFPVPVADFEAATLQVEYWYNGTKIANGLETPEWVNIAWENAAFKTAIPSVGDTYQHGGETYFVSQVTGAPGDTLTATAYTVRVDLTKEQPPVYAPASVTKTPVTAERVTLNGVTTLKQGADYIKVEEKDGTYAATAGVDEDRATVLFAVTVTANGAGQVDVTDAGATYVGMSGTVAAASVGQDGKVTLNFAEAGTVILYFSKTATFETSNTVTVSNTVAVKDGDGDDTNDKSASEVKVTKTVAQPSLTVNKTYTISRDGQTVTQGNAKPGDVVTYTITVTNNGNVELSDVTVKDTFTGAVAPDETWTTTNGKFEKTWTIASLAVGASNSTATYTYAVQSADAGKTITNTAVAESGTTKGEGTTKVTVYNPDMTVTKAVTKVNYTEVDSDKTVVVQKDDVLTYTITVKNTGDQDLTNVIVTDTKWSNGTKITVSGVNNPVTLTSGSYTISSLAEDAIVTITYTYTVTDADVTAREVTNKVFVKSYETPGGEDGGTTTKVVGNYTIIASSGANGTISPEGSVTVTAGADKTFTITADAGYHISDVTVDGVSMGTVSSYTFENVQANHTIHATFAKNSTPTSYTLYYHPNFGGYKPFYQSSSTRNVTVKKYENVGHLPERDGYVFVSWNTEPDGSGERYMPGDTFRIDGSSDNLYAQWQKDKTGPDDSGVSNWLETDEHRAYLTGYPDSTFRADRNMTRAEVAQMFYALLLDKNVTITKSFSDVPDDAWYATAVKTLASLGMMDGYPDGTFRPDEPITRAEFATVGLAFAYDPFDADCSYYDVSASAWYHTYVAQATTYGWIGGYPDNTFRPGNNITRVEVCVIVNNMLGRDADERYIDRHEDELVHFVDLSDSYWGYYTIMESTNTHEYTGSFTNEKWTDVK
ncbi:S-layer homology domain-containing protein [Flintibacter porci]|uniref:S-layer homology domain-containing protein n=1 Tax=Flintibacter porci TaxID=3342383 RepID=UPI003F8CB83A